MHVLSSLSANSSHKCTETTTGLYCRWWDLSVCFMYSSFPEKVIISHQMPDIQVIVSTL